MRTKTKSKEDMMKEENEIKNVIEGLSDVFSKKI